MPPADSCLSSPGTGKGLQQPRAREEGDGGAPRRGPVDTRIRAVHYHTTGVADARAHRPTARPTRRAEPLLQRLSIAVKHIPGVARMHFSRWDDGSEHVHLWALARPLGMMQGRGAMLAFWDDVLPPMPDDLVAEHLQIVARGMADGGGTALR